VFSAEAPPAAGQNKSAETISALFESSARYSQAGCFLSLSMKCLRNLETFGATTDMQYG
jgi:hypothetical protein